MISDGGKAKLWRLTISTEEVPGAWPEGEPLAGGKDPAKWPGVSCRCEGCNPASVWSSGFAYTMEVTRACKYWNTDPLFSWGCWSPVTTHLFGRYDWEFWWILPCLTCLYLVKWSLVCIFGTRYGFIPQTHFLTHGLYFKVFFNTALKMLTGSSLGIRNLPLLLTWCFSGWRASFSLWFSRGERVPRHGAAVPGRAGVGAAAPRRRAPMGPRGSSCCGTPGQGRRRGICTRLLPPRSSLVCKCVWVVSPPVSPCHVPQLYWWERGDTGSSHRWRCHHCRRDLPQVPSVLQSHLPLVSLSLPRWWSSPPWGHSHKACSSFLESLIFFFSSLSFSVKAEIQQKLMRPPWRNAGSLHWLVPAWSGSGSGMSSLQTQ